MKTQFNLRPLKVWALFISILSLISTDLKSQDIKPLTKSKSLFTDKKSAPITYPIYMGMIEDFKKYYAKVNPSIIDTPLKVNWYDLCDSIQRDSNDFVGIGFYYVLDTLEATEQPYYTYLICGYKSVSDSTLVPINGKYFLLNDKGKLTPKSESNLYGYINAYFDKIIVLDDYENINWIMLKDRKGDGDHPFLCYYLQSFEEFISDNQLDNTSFLWIYNGARYHNTSNNKLRYHAQSPVLIWGDSDQASNPSYVVSRGRVYNQNALDVGHLCPPDCQ